MISQIPAAGWLALSLTSDALKPARHRWVEAGPRNGRYLRSMKVGRSVLKETARLHGLDLYHPEEAVSALHKRTKAVVTQYRPLVPGYAFCRPVADIAALAELAGIAGVLTMGEGLPPVIVPDADIDRLMQAEREIAARNAMEIERENLKRLKVPRSVARKHFAGKRIRIKSDHFAAGQTVSVDDVTGRQTVKAMVQFLGGLVLAEFPLDQVEIMD